MGILKCYKTSPWSLSLVLSRNGSLFLKGIDPYLTSGLFRLIVQWLAALLVTLLDWTFTFTNKWPWIWSSLVAQMVKNLPAMQETQVWSLGQEDPLEKETVTDSSILSWRIPWTEEPGGLVSGVTKSQTCLSDYANTCTHVHVCAHAHTHTQSIGSRQQADYFQKEALGSPEWVLISLFESIILILWW